MLIVKSYMKDIFTSLWLLKLVLLLFGFFVFITGFFEFCSRFKSWLHISSNFYRLPRFWIYSVSGFNFRFNKPTETGQTEIINELYGIVGNSMDTRIVLSHYPPLSLQIIELLVHKKYHNL